MSLAIALRRRGCPRARKCSRAIFHADSTDSDPPEVKKARFRSPGMIEASLSASSIAAGCAVPQSVLNASRSAARRRPRPSPRRRSSRAARSTGSRGHRRSGAPRCRRRTRPRPGRGSAGRRRRRAAPLAVKCSSRCSRADCGSAAALRVSVMGLPSGVGDADHRGGGPAGNVRSGDDRRVPVDDPAERRTAMRREDQPFVWAPTWQDAPREPNGFGEPLSHGGPARSPRGGAP